MTTPVTLEEAISAAAQLPPGQLQILIDILQHRQNEARRSEIAAEAQQSIQLFKQGNLKPAGITDLLSSLHETLDE